MAEDRFSAMDEGSLRKLLEVTLDLADRREIRTAIRELRRKELERCEEALATKRFRSERNEQEDKENQPGAEQEKKQQRALHTLAGRLQDISDVDELTALLRAANEYEERKLIRAAIRKIRDDEIEAASLACTLVSSQDRDNGAMLSRSMERKQDSVPFLAKEKADLEERQRIKAQIHEFRRTQNGGSHPAETQDAPSDWLLNLSAPINKQSSSSSSSSTSEAANVSEITERTSSSTDSDAETISQNERNKQSTELTVRDKSTLDAKPSNSCELDAVVDKKIPSESVGKPSNYIQRGDNKQTFTGEKAAESSSVPDGSIPFTPFRRANSVRDRVKKFTEEPPGMQSSLGPRFGSMRGERIPARNGHAQFFAGLQNGQGTQKTTHDEKASSKPGLYRAIPGPTGNKADQCSGAGPQSASKTHTFKFPSVPEFKSSRSASIKGSSSHSSAGLNMPSGEVSRRLPQSQSSFIPKQSDGRSHGDQLHIPQSTTEWAKQVENRDGTIKTPEEHGSSQHSTTPLSTDAKGEQQDTDMKTLLTIEIKDGRNQTTNSRIVGQPGNQRAELTLGLTASPFRITSGVSSSTTSAGSTISTSSISTSSGVNAHSTTNKSSITIDRSVNSHATSKQVDNDVTPQPSQQLEVFLPSTIEKVETEMKKKLTTEDLRAIEEEEVLDKLLDSTTDFEERRMIRTAMRELRQRKRDQREKEREQRMQELKNKERESRLARTTESRMRQTATTNQGSAVSTITKTQRLVQSNDGSKTSRTTTMEASYMKRSETGGTIVQTKSSFSATSKVGSIFDREDDASSRANSAAAMERRQAERKKELMKAQSLPKTPATQSRKAMIEKMEKESGSPANPAFAKVATPRSAFGVPNANSIKQMLLDWCKAKTRGYEHVDIQNFSSSWSDGMAFCALVHNFFPEAFDYNQLAPQNRRQNFDLAFSAAEKHADCPQLLDAEDMVRLREPDWKCVYTYIQEFYRCLVQKGMVKTKKS
uniref:Smoothelin n=1 Tax=Leptobrachium leishanense TaxID=445787 RepID=A0A8C5PU61_9ANUR